jgi:hypothetical protein
MLLANQQLLFQREPIETSHSRSEHSQRGAQRSEQYLYGAQRVIKSKVRVCSLQMKNRRIDDGTARLVTVLDFG